MNVTATPASEHIAGISPNPYLVTEKWKNCGICSCGFGEEPEQKVNYVNCQVNNVPVNQNIIADQCTVCLQYLSPNCVSQELFKYMHKVVRSKKTKKWLGR